MKLIFFNMLISCLVLNVNSFGQVSALQGKAGETSILVNGGGLFLNTGDSNISGSFSFGEGNAGKSNFYGVNLKFKSTEGVTTLFDGQKFKAEFDGSGYWMHGFGDIANLNEASKFVYALIGYKRAKYNILQTASNIEFNESSFDGLFLTSGFNIYGGIEAIKSSALFGISLSYGHYNNIDNLKSVQRYIVNSDTTSGQQVNLLREKKGGYEGTYLTTNGVRLNIDGYIYPPFFDKQNVGLGGFTRIFRGDTFSKSNIGLGVIVGNPTGSDIIVLGFFYQFQNVFNEAEGGIKQTISLTAGYNF